MFHHHHYHHQQLIFIDYTLIVIYGIFALLSVYLILIYIIIQQKQMSNKRIQTKVTPLFHQNQNNLNFHNSQHHQTPHQKQQFINNSLKNKKLKIKVKQKTQYQTSNSKVTPKNLVYATQMSNELLENRIRTENNQKMDQNCQNYHLRKIIFILYKYFQKCQVSWHLQKLNYKQLLIILKEMRYIKSSDEQSYQKGLNSLGLTQLKQCYWLWNNIRIQKHFNFVNLVIILLCIENLQFDLQLIKEVVNELSKGIFKFKLLDPPGQPKYIFLVKKQGYIFSKDGLIELNKIEKEKIQHQLKNFKYNKLMQNTPQVQLQGNQETQKICLSKKSSLLAIHKRQRILQQIRQKEPQIKNIQLHHLLNYKESACKTKALKSGCCNPYTCKKVNEPPSITKICFENDKYQQKHELLIKKQKAKPLKKENLIIPNTKSKFKIKESRQIKPKMTLSLSIIQEKQQKQNQIKSCIKSNNVLDYLYQDEQKSIISHVKQTLLTNPLNDEQQMILKQSSILFEEQIYQGETTVEPLPSFDKAFNNNNPISKQPKKRQFFEIPILYVDVNIQQGKKQRIIIYDGDTAYDLAVQFGKKFGLNQDMVSRLELMLEQQINSVLSKIQQALQEDCSHLY